MTTATGRLAALLTAVALGVAVLPADEPKKGEASWPMFGGTPARNMVNLTEKGLPETWSVKKNKQQNVKWIANLGKEAQGGVTVAGGRIFVGTNNEIPRNKAIKGDKGVLMCFEAATGNFLWQAVHDKLPEPAQNDWPNQGICSTPCVEGDRVYYVSNRCELVCADVKGDPDKPGEAKFVWKLDMIGKLGVYPSFLAVGSPMIVGDLVYTVTANGTIPYDEKVPAPDAPSFIAVNKNTGKVEWKSSAPGKNIMEGQWSNPAYAEAGGGQVLFPGGDGWLYSFEAKKGELLWKFNCNPRNAVWKPGGRGDKNHFLATPVVVGDKCYLAVGINPEDGPGVGHLWCIDLTRKPTDKDKDVSPRDEKFDPKAAANKDSALVWHFGGEVLPKPDMGREVIFCRSLSTCAVHDGLCYAADLDGFLYCLDAKTGEKYWEFDLGNSTWSSPMWIDGKVYMGNDSGALYVVEHGKKLKELAKIEMGAPVRTPPVAVGGVVYLNAGGRLIAIAK